MYSYYIILYIYDIGKCSQSKSQKVVDVVEAEYSCKLHTQDHFEIIYIHYGNGVYVFNELTVPYEEGDLFLLASGDNRHCIPFPFCQIQPKFSRKVGCNKRKKSRKI
ncbi:AraC family ligand binding domain-containing protein [Parabacteroides sp. PH5-16]|uniref:AraC family ligand binding domain-containing protein n=1 Tax=Parabacteroides sp. PH5-16 TaxID=2940625 RepID=UPI0038B2E8D3